MARQRLIIAGLLGLALASAPVLGGEIPAWLPRYDLTVRVDVEQHQVQVRQRVTWTNPHKRPAGEVVFNVHSHYAIADKDVGFLAKMVEILRMAPSESLSFAGPACTVQKVMLVTSPVVVADSRQKSPPPSNPPQPLSFHYRPDNATALVVPLPTAIGPGESVTLDLDFTLQLPQRKGRWGQWLGVTTLAQWLPVAAYYDDQGWQPVPFIPWHQPFFNEAGIYSGRITVPADQKVATTGTIEAIQETSPGWKEYKIAPTCARDFALLCSSRWLEFEGQLGEVKIRCLALPEHEFYAREMIKIAARALPVYGRWFGPYPYPQFTIVESFFGWNGNECGGLVMIDDRMFGMPHIARNYIDYLLSHELCHQWWYNIVGTNGYAETWMDEGITTYFSHRLINDKLGKNNKILDYPRGLDWLPNIQREDYRNYSLLGVVGRGEGTSVVQDMPGFKHLVNLSAMTYDRGSKVVGMIEERLGEAAFLDFIRQVYQKYYFRILRVADFQRELEAYTGRSWEEFFQVWLKSTGGCDWGIGKVAITGSGERPKVYTGRLTPAARRGRPVKVIVHLHQKGAIAEPTVLGFRLDEEEGYQVRVPIHPEIPSLELPEFQGRVEIVSSDVTVAKSGSPVQNHEIRVEVTLPSAPSQISVDPDQVLLDSNPINNHWKPEVRVRLTPLYFQLDETDLTNSYDRWNFILGPWVYGASYSDPWYTKSPMIGLRAGVYRTQQFNGGGYLAYRTNDRNIVAGLDTYIDHFPLPHTQIGVNVERSLATLGPEDIPCSRGVIYGRYIMTYGSSLYLPPFEYVEVFGALQNRCLPYAAETMPGADPFDRRAGLGIHYHKNYLTPYWDPEGGIYLDATYQGGLPILTADEGFQQVYGQVSTVKYTPDPWGWLESSPYLSWLKETRWAFRLHGAAGLPLRGQFFTLGGGDYFRGFDLRERQGSVTWTGSIEWRIPLARQLTWDCCDHFVGVRNIYLAPFYDVGDAYLRGHSFGPVAHAVGAGLRVDLAWLGLIERTILRFDVAKTVNVDSPVQFWFGVQHPF